MNEHRAGLGEERRTAACLLGGGPRGLLVRERDPLFGLPSHLQRLLEEVDEYADLGPQDLGDDGREDVVDGPE